MTRRAIPGRWYSLRPVAALGLLSIAFGIRPLAADEPSAPSPDSVRAALDRAAGYYRSNVATHGGYVYFYTPDLRTRWGEGLATEDQIWVQPPGTPTVGMAFLAAYRATGERSYRDAATDAALALVHGQLESGAWTNAVDFDPRGDQVARYRNGRGGGRKSRNFSTLDDGISQAAMQLLMRVDQAHEFNHRAIHDAVRLALDRLLAAQFPNGGFPQGWDEEPAPRPEPKPANYPEYDWRTEGRIKNYWDMYTLNDGVAGTVAETLILAESIYREPRFNTALRRLGDFLRLAQMPQPQPAWAQQYNYDMQPIWARRFEPAAIAGRESQDALQTLLRIFRHTGEARYLEPIPAALAYLRRSQLPDGRLARYYELRTNRPLYMFRRGKEYFLTHDDDDLPEHYGWKVASRLDDIQREHEACRAGRTKQEGASEELNRGELERAAGRIAAELDDEGRWISTYEGERLVGQPKFQLGEKYLSSAVFSRNVRVLSDYLQAAADSRR